MRVPTLPPIGVGHFHEAIGVHATHSESAHCRAVRSGGFMSQVKITVDGKEIHAAAGSLLIDVCKSAGIEIPSFCYYPGFAPGCLPHVSGGDCQSAETADGVHYPGGRWDGGNDGEPGGRQAARRCWSLCSRIILWIVRCATPGDNASSRMQHCVTVLRNHASSISRTTGKSNSGLPWSISIVLAASCATDALGFVAREWTYGHWASLIAILLS